MAILMLGECIMVLLVCYFVCSFSGIAQKEDLTLFQFTCCFVSLLIMYVRVCLGRNYYPINYEYNACLLSYFSTNRLVEHLHTSDIAQTLFYGYAELKHCFLN